MEQQQARDGRLHALITRSQASLVNMMVHLDGSMSTSMMASLKASIARIRLLVWLCSFTLSLTCAHGHHNGRLSSRFPHHVNSFACSLIEPWRHRLIRLQGEQLKQLWSKLSQGQHMGRQQCRCQQNLPASSPSQSPAQPSPQSCTAGWPTPHRKLSEPPGRSRTGSRGGSPLR